ncbi:heat-shock protein Hsp90 [Tenacibaculum bernardetii]|uniref:heat-shock protein Hsp90 n=1 Tax=Tenacibaculum bernardetii TaxID=3021375 RepID=UPI0023AF31D5|nr:heat-shock protein Hsp90 [Tenacibaculum bernardetii]
MKTLFSLALVFSLFLNASAQIISAKEFTSSIEKKHQKEVFMKKKYISFDIDIKFGGAEHLLGKITQETGGGKIKIEKKDGSIIIFDGTNVYVKGIAEKLHEGARFDIFTWSYFLGLPYKLNDKGTIWSDLDKNKWGQVDLETAKLSFSSGTGDAPDDWYIIYKNSKSSILEGAAYIVSYGKGKEKAEKEPHAIKYNSYTVIDGALIPKNWTFHMWSLEDGYKNKIGEVQLSNVIFTEQADFSKPKGSVVVNAPKL